MTYLTLPVCLVFLVWGLSASPLGTLLNMNRVQFLPCPQSEGRIMVGLWLLWAPIAVTNRSYPNAFFPLPLSLDVSVHLFFSLVETRTNHIFHFTFVSFVLISGYHPVHSDIRLLILRCPLMLWTRILSGFSIEIFHLFVFSSPPEAWSFMFHFYIPAIEGFSASIAMKFFFYACSFMWRFKASSRPHFSKHRAFYLFILLWWRRCFIWCYLNKQKKAALRIASQIIYYYLNVI